MTFFMENGLAIAVIGGLATTLALVFFMARRTGGSLSALWRRPSRRRSCCWRLNGSFRPIGSRSPRRCTTSTPRSSQNDVDGVLALIDPNATQMRADVQALMPSVKVESAGSGRNIEVDARRIGQRR